MSKKRRLSKLAKELQPHLNGSGGGAPIVVSGGGGGSSPGDDYLLRSGANAMTGHLNMGTRNIINVAFVDGVDISELALETSGFDARIDALEGRTVQGTSPVVSDATLLGDGNPTISLDLATMAGDGLGATATSLYAKVQDGIEISGDFAQVDLDYDFDWTGDHTHTGYIGSSSFASGYAGYGWRIDSADASMQLNDLTVRGTLNVYELLAHQIRATNGDVFISATGKVESVSGSGPYTIATDPEHGFAVGDLIRAKRFDIGDGGYDSKMTVTAVADSKNFTATLYSGDAPAVGYEYVRHGNTTDADRQGSIYLSSDDSDAPFIDFIDGVDSWTDWNTAGVIKARLGNLEGITDDQMGNLSGYGLWADAVYLNGSVVAADGEVRLNDRGLVFNTGDLEANAIKWQYDATDDESDVLGEMSTYWYEVTGTVRTYLSILSRWGSDYGTDDAYLHLGVSESGGASETTAYFEIHGQALPEAELRLRQYDLTLGTFTVRAHVSQYGDILPGTSGVNIGSAGAPFDELHVNTIYAGTTSSTDTGHNHNDLYYTESETDALLATKAASSHTHAGLVTTATLAAHTSDATIHRSINDAGSSTTDLWSADKIASEVAAASGEVSMALFNAHTGDTSIHSELDDAGTSASTIWSSSKITTYLAAELADYAESADLHDAVTVGANLTLSGQLVGLGVDVALIDEEKTWTAEQTFGGGIGLPLDLGDDWEIDASGVIRSAGDNAFSSGVTGIYLSPTGRLEAGDVKIRGEIAASVFSYEAEVLNNGSMRWTPGGAATLGADLVVPAVGASASVRVNDSDLGQFVQFMPGHILRIKGIADITNTTYSGEHMGFDFDVFPVGQAVPNSSVNTVDVWLEVTGHILSSGYITYAADVLKTTASGATIRAGAGIASYKDPSSTSDNLGYIYAVANDGFSPRMEFGYVGDEPWNGEEYPQIVIGRRDGTALITDTDPGILISPNASNSLSGYLTVDTEDIYGRNIGLQFDEIDGAGNVETFLQIDKDRGIVVTVPLATQDDFLVEDDTGAEEWQSFTPPETRQIGMESSIGQTFYVGSYTEEIATGYYAAHVDIHGGDLDTHYSSIMNLRAAHHTAAGKLYLTYNGDATGRATLTGQQVYLTANGIALQASDQVSIQSKRIRWPNPKIGRENAAIGDWYVVGGGDETLKQRLA